MSETFILAPAYLFIYLFIYFQDLAPNLIYSDLAPRYWFLSKCHFLFCFCLLTHLSPLDGECQPKHSGQLNCDGRRLSSCPQSILLVLPGDKNVAVGWENYSQSNSLPPFCTKITTDITAITHQHSGTKQCWWCRSRASQLEITISVWKMAALPNERGKIPLPWTNPGLIEWLFFFNNYLLHSEYPHCFVSVAFSLNTGCCLKLPECSLENKDKALFPF